MSPQRIRESSNNRVHCDFFRLRRFGLHDIVDLVNRYKNSEFKGKQAILSTWNSEIKQNQGNPSGLE